MENGTAVYVTTRTFPWMSPEDRQAALLPGTVVRANRYKVDVETAEGVVGVLPKYVVTQDQEVDKVALRQWARDNFDRVMSL